MADKSNQSRAVEDFTEFEDRVSSYSRKGPVRKSSPSGDALKDVLEVLYSEHRYITSLLDALEQQAERLKPGKIPDYHLLLEIVDYLTHYPGQYHHPREDMLFDQLLECDASFKPRVERLLREHATLDHYNHELLNELTRIADGRPADRARLLQIIERYLAGYREHIDYESHEVFPRAKGSLAASDLRKLAVRTRYIDDPMFGGEVQYRYQRARRSMQARVENAGSQLIVREMTGIEAFIGNLSEVADTVGRLKTTVGRQGRDAWQEQVDTFREHLAGDGDSRPVLLPVALAKNYKRHLVEGLDEIRQVLKGKEQDGR